MKNSTVFGLTAIALLAVFTLLVLKLVPSTSEFGTSSVVPESDIRGMAVVHKGLPNTLNFDQQKIATHVLSRSVQVKKSDYPQSAESFPFEKIILYRFNAPDLEILPIQFQENNLVFSIPLIDPQNYYLEQSDGQFKEMISSSFDP